MQKLTWIGGSVFPAKGAADEAVRGGVSSRLQAWISVLGRIGRLCLSVNRGRLIRPRSRQPRIGGFFGRMVKCLRRRPC